MKEALSVQELKAMCKYFFEAGELYGKAQRPLFEDDPDEEEMKATDFEPVFNNLMLGKYNKMIESESLKVKWDEMQADIQKAMDKWDDEQRGKAGQVIEDIPEELFLMPRLIKKEDWEEEQPNNINA